ncbi:MAG TPA: sigma-54 dependent transcriptional regulator [Ktedonobacterales bacterium]
MSISNHRADSNGESDDAALRAQRCILVADDEADIRALLRSLFETEGYQVQEAETGDEVLRILAKPEGERPDLALVDVRMPSREAADSLRGDGQPPTEDGIQTLQRLHEQGVEVPIIIMTAFGSSSLAIKAIQLGAFDYITKPFDELDDVLLNVNRVFEHQRLAQEVRELRRRVESRDPTDRMVGRSSAMIDIFKTIGLVARNPATVLITGETGTGKELMAETIHLASDRRLGPLVKVNCAALPETLLESELFGHEKGSFTGAIAQHKGRFEAANKGTIFLDEVGEMTLSTQKKLLRVLQEREFERVGGTLPVKIDVRVVAATNKNLRDEVLAGRFREDLFFRLNVIAVHMPPLRERRDDIPALVAHFLDKHRFSPTTPPGRISEDAMNILEHYDWPGNVRELENIVERAVVMSRGGVITTQHIVFANELNRYVLDIDQKVRQKMPLDEMLREVEREAIRTALRQNDQEVVRAAALLGVTPEYLTQRMTELLPRDKTA